MSVVGGWSSDPWKHLHDYKAPKWHGTFICIFNLGRFMIFHRETLDFRGFPGGKCWFGSCGHGIALFWNFPKGIALIWMAFILEFHWFDIFLLELRWFEFFIVELHQCWLFLSWNCDVSDFIILELRHFGFFNPSIALFLNLTEGIAFILIFLFGNCVNVYILSWNCTDLTFFNVELRSYGLFDVGITMILILLFWACADSDSLTLELR